MPVATSCPEANVIPTEANREAARAATLCLVNRERSAHGEAPLRLNEALDRAAQAHSESMAANEYFEHSGPGGVSLLQRLKAVGYIYSSQLMFNLGENIAWGSLQLAAPAAIVAAWMASPGHRANILDPAFRDNGIGIVARLPSSLVAGQTGAMYTQDFGVVM